MNKSKNNSKTKHNSKTKNKNKVTKGGKFIGDGAIACTYSPNFKGDNIDIDSKLLSKLEKKVHFNSYFNKIKDVFKLNLIDPKFNYFIYPLFGDRIRKISIDDLSQCSLFTDNSQFRIGEDDNEFILQELNNRFVNVIIPYGGVELEKYVATYDFKTKDNFNKFIINIIDLIKSVYLLNINGIAHMDIKPQNILVDDEQNIRLIDFNLSTNNFDVYNEQFNIRHNFYRYWPLDFIFFIQFKEDITEIDNLIDYYDFFNKNTSKISNADLRKRIYNDLDEFITYIQENNVNLSKVFKLVMSSLDTYSLGLTLYNDIYIKYLKDIFDMYYSPEVGHNFRKIFTDCIKPNPYKRPQINKVLEEYLKFLKDNNFISSNEASKEYDIIEKLKKYKKA